MFMKPNEFSLYIEGLKREHGFETYIETVTYYVENESDEAYSNIVRNLSPKIIKSITIEATKLKLIKHQTIPESLLA